MKSRLLVTFVAFWVLLTPVSAAEWARVGSPQGPASAWFVDLKSRVTDGDGVTKYWSVVRYQGDMVVRKNKPVGTLMLLLGDRCDVKTSKQPLGPYKAIYYDHQKQLIEKVEKPGRLTWFSLLTPQLAQRNHQLICAPETLQKNDALPHDSASVQGDSATTTVESGQLKRKKLLLEELDKTTSAPPPPPADGKVKADNKNTKDAKTDKPDDKSGTDTGKKK